VKRMLAILFALLAQLKPAEPPAVIVLGIAQDGGVPHAGCHQKVCKEARRDPSKRRLVASLGLLDPAAGKRFLIDATPDFALQMERLGGMPDAIFLTHAHIGHYLGLAQLGREVLGAHKVPVYATPSMAKFLRENGPWKRLVGLENIVLNELPPGATIQLTPSLKVTAIQVPHRDEDSDTVAFLVEGPRKTILWLPDIDKWEKWDRRIEEMFQDPTLIAFVDGSFFTSDEIPGRSQAEIPHPLVSETMARFGASPPHGRLFFVHLNHTNRLLWDAAAVKEIKRMGFDVAGEGMKLLLD
jgi:pyrroloquinoline quinone biosynthesis protein B